MQQNFHHNNNNTKKLYRMNKSSLPHRNSNLWWQNVLQINANTANITAKTTQIKNGR